MDKEYKNIDDLFRSELMEEEVVVPDFIKANIDEVLGFNKSKKYFFYLSFLLVLITGASLLFFIPNWSSITSISRKDSSKFSHSNQLTLLNASANLTSSGNTSNDQQLVSDSNSLLASDGSMQQYSNSSLKNKIAYNSADKRRKNTTGGAGNFTNYGGIDTKKDNKTSGSSKGGFGSANSGFKKTTSTEDNGDNLSDKTLGNSGITKSDESDSEKNLATKNPDNSEPEIEQGTKIDTTGTSAKNTGNHSKAGTSISDSSRDINPTTIVKTPEKNDQTWMLTLTSGLTFTNSNYTATTPLDANIFKTATSDRIGNQTNFDAMYRFKIPISIGAGIGLANYSDNYDFQRKTFQLDSTLISEYIYYEKIYGTYYATKVDTFEVMGSYTFLKDSILVTVDTTIYSYEEKEVIENFVGRNQASYLMVPLHFGTHFSYKKFEFNLLASARFNFLLNSSGGYLLDNEFTSFTKSTSIYKPFYVDLALSSHINYNIWKNLYLAGNLQYRPRIGTSFENVNFNKSFDSFHVGIGIGIKL